MKTHVPDNCGNSPRSLLAIEISVNLAANKYDKLEPLLDDDFMLCIAGSDKVVSKRQLASYADAFVRSKVSVEKLEILTSISHGKYAAVSYCSCMSDGEISYSHDLYEFTSAGGSAKLRKITQYVVYSRH